jgi:glycosyltransferase involved in cell wall biosynthesis
MNQPRRLSVCYLVPGHDLLASVGPSRNVLNLAQALARHADVTVAFRRVADTDLPRGIRVLEIQPAVTAATIDDAAMRGISLAEFLSFMRALRRFVRDELQTFDVVLEKSWLLSGYVSSLCRRRGQLGVPVENIVSNPAHAARRQPLKRLRLHVAHWIAGRAMRRAPLVIAETEFLKKEIAESWKVAPERIAVVDLGVDRGLFRPADQATTRRKLGIPPDRTVLVYVGVLDFTHDLEPAIRALGAAGNRGIELHVVGDGRRREEYGRTAEAVGAQMVFHGRVAHTEVPTYIAAADLCLAPYDASAFASGELGYATMKIPEYLSVGRAVVSVPSGRVRTLVRDGTTGFLFENDVVHWTAFLADLPSRERLHEMGHAAAASKLPSWDDTAEAYLALCQERLRAVPRLQE